MRLSIKGTLLGGAAALLAAMGGGTGASASHQVSGFEADASRLVGAITTKGVVAHMNELQWIADYRGGHRSTASSGYAASVSYVRRKLEAAGYRTSTQPFTFTMFEELAPPALLAGSRRFEPNEDVATFEYSGAGKVTGKIVPIDLQVPPPAAGSSTSGCEPGDFPSPGAKPAIALIQRGTCTFDDKVANAVAAGYDAAVIFNEGQKDRTDLLFGVLSEGVRIPVVGTTYQVGRDLLRAAKDGAAGQVAVQARVIERKTYNITADTAQGRSDRTVVVGAHLDSVREGPGINDNGSGSAAVLELALQMARLELKPANRVRFAWWGAEEQGLYGSTHYVESLKPGQQADILAYLNFDMIASHNYVWQIQQGNPDSLADQLIEQVFAKYFQRARLPYEFTPANGRSDYAAFSDAGIPVGGLFSGAEEIKTPRQARLFGGRAGQPFDSCYHKACDTTRHISRYSTLVLSRAIADTVYKLAMTGRDLRATTAKAAAPPLASTLAAQPAGPDRRGPFLVR